LTKYLNGIIILWVKKDFYGLFAEGFRQDAERNIGEYRRGFNCRAKVVRKNDECSNQKAMRNTIEIYLKIYNEN
jgi:hypothetical protein